MPSSQPLPALGERCTVVVAPVLQPHPLHRSPLPQPVQARSSRSASGVLVGEPSWRLGCSSQAGGMRPAPAAWACGRRRRPGCCRRTLAAPLYMVPGAAAPAPAVSLSVGAAAPPGAQTPPRSLGSLRGKEVLAAVGRVPQGLPHAALVGKPATGGQPVPTAAWSQRCCSAACFLHALPGRFLQTSQVLPAGAGRLWQVRGPSRRPARSKLHHR